MEGTPLKGANIFFDTDSWDHPGAIMKASDGYYYGVSTLASIATVNYRSFHLVHDQLNNSNGVFFRIDPATFEVKVLHVFEGKAEYLSGNIKLVETDAYENDLSTPIYAPVEVSPGVFYGLCEQGGPDDVGGIYKFETATATYSHLASFDRATHGLGIYSPLTKGDGDNYYGVLKTKNKTDHGFLYKINTSNNQLDFVKDLSDATKGILWVINNPRGSLVYNASLNSLLSVKDRFDVQSNWGGGCYSYNIGTGELENEWSILYTQLSTLGNQPVGICAGGNGKYYIITHDGGANDNGTIIEYTYGSAPLKVVDFPAESSQYNIPSGEGLQVIGDKIYGFYVVSADNNSYTMWSFDYINSSFNSFLKTNATTFGTAIQTSFIYDNGNFVSQSMFGGPGNAGSIFEYDPTTTTTTVKKSNQSPNGRNLVGGIYIKDNELWAIANKGGESATDYAEGGGYVKYNLANDQSEFTPNKYVQIQRNVQNAFQISAVDEGNNKLYQITDLHREIDHQKKFVRTDMITGEHKPLKQIDANTFLTSPIFMNGKVYFANADSIKVYNTVSEQFETSSYIGDKLVYGLAKGELIKGTDNKLYGYTSNLRDNGGTTKSCIFSYDLSNGTVVIVAEFGVGCRSFNTSLTEYNNKLYGASNYGGTNSNGYIFSMDMTTNKVDTLYNIDGATDGRIFEGSFTVYEDELYALAYSGGQNGNGTLVSFDPSDNSLTTLEHLTVENGRPFKSTPTFWDEKILAISDIQKENVSFTISPNPASASFVINNDNYDLVTIYNVSGKMVKRFDHSDSYDISTLADGLYIVQVLKNNQLIDSKKLIITK
jgi:hypothetical protein